VELSTINEKVERVSKHVNSLAVMGLAMEVEKNVYQLSSELFERHDLRSLNRKDQYTEKQVAMINDLRLYLNMTHKQAVDHVYKNEAVAQYSIHELMKKGVVDFKRVYMKNGQKETVYFLSKERGKKEAVRVSGVDDRKIFNSKIMNRPEELYHDLLVYEAYVDFKERIESEGGRVTLTLTDKEMRSIDQGHKDSIQNYMIIKSGGSSFEIPDMYMEYLDVNNEKCAVNIEVDVGYKRQVIESKGENIENLVWYTDTKTQAGTIKSVLPDAEIIMIKL